LHPIFHQTCPTQKTINLQKLRALHPEEVAFGGIAAPIAHACGEGPMGSASL